MGQVIDLNAHRSDKAVNQAINAIHNHDKAGFEKGMEVLLRDAQALAQEAKRLYPDQPA